ncbi:MAG: type Z 30S ribosomal protein S14 [Verrucomicrobiae bacterium]|nr:type Z 30S ribosomal protein S14 [Verrucomicrobiae bacterium]
MAKTCLMEKQKRAPKFAARRYHRCRVCGRARAYMRRFDMCRLCFREHATKGLIPGVTKASW